MRGHRRRLLIMGAIVVACGFVTSASADSDLLKPIDIKVAFSSDSEVEYYELRAPNQMSQFELYYFKGSARIEAERSDIPASFVVLLLSGTAGRHLVQSFADIGVSADTRDYWNRVPDRLVESSHDGTTCGVVLAGAHRVVGCPIGPVAKKSQSADSNRVAWFIRTLELIRFQADDKFRLGSSKHFGKLLAQLISEIDNVSRFSTDAADSAARLRWNIARAGVFSGAIDNPVEHEDRDVRRAAVEVLSGGMPSVVSREGLLTLLSDSEIQVRAAAAYALSLTMKRDDVEVIRALRRVLSGGDLAPPIRAQVERSLGAEPEEFNRQVE